MLRKLLLSVSLLLLPAVSHAAESAAKGDVTMASKVSKTSKAPTASRRTAKTPARAKAGASRKRAAARPDPRLQFLQQFADADDDADGLLSRQEVERNLPAVGEKFDSVDASGDGWLTPEELRDFLQSSRGSEPHG